MKTGTLLVALVVAGACIAGIVWMAGGASTIDIGKPKPKPDEAALEISEEGPWPTVTVKEPLHNFDVMAVGSTKSHKFEVKNEGDSPLKLKIKGTTCKCTVGELDKDEIKPGETGEVELSWHPETPQEEFQKYAEIYTNDPKQKILTLTIRGRVEELLTINPIGDLVLTDMVRDKPVKRVVTIFSKVLEKFHVEPPEPSRENIQAKVVPLPEEDLLRLDARSGYLVLIDFDPKELKTGDFKEEVLVKTDVEGAEKIPFVLRGNFAGSIRGLPYHPPGVNASKMRWQPSILQTNLGDVNVDEGGQGWYKLIIGDMPEGTDFEVSKIESSLDFVTASVEMIESPPNSTKQIAVVTFQVKPGAPLGAHVRKNAAKVVLKTNHPNAPEIKFYLEFVVL